MRIQRAVFFGFPAGEEEESWNDQGDGRCIPLPARFFLGSSPLAVWYSPVGEVGLVEESRCGTNRNLAAFVARARDSAS